jgi:hypothetical protein
LKRGREEVNHRFHRLHRFEEGVGLGATPSLAAEKHLPQVPSPKRMRG